MSEEHRSAEDPARAAPGDEERRLARKALAGRARDAADLSLLMDMLGLDPAGDPGRGAAHAPLQPAPAAGPPPRPDRFRGLPVGAGGAGARTAP
ncbi:hypothetical protein, partial [Streptomyces sp. NPDC001657]|uniref:hypothetical protein n=1 Tax=Streptomyces sp. NPDC001657 TaxID=3154522 RepID=UPI0033345117